MVERYTEEEIWYMDAGVLTLGNDKLRGLIANALSKVPKVVADRVSKDCFILMPMYDYEFGYHISKSLLQNKCIIAFPEKLLEKDEKSIIHTVLHEIAHHYLDHKSPMLEMMSNEEEKRQEDDADKQMEKWLRE